MKLKKSIIEIWLTILFSGIAYLLWYNEFVYSFPTPGPKNYKMVNCGDKIVTPQTAQLKGSRPLLLHFLNPDYTCPRFNMSYFKMLVKKYRNEVTFAFVVISHKNFTVEEIQNKFDLQLPVYFDLSTAATSNLRNGHLQKMETPALNKMIKPEIGFIR